MSGKQVVVIGGGVIGAATAHYARAAGYEVTILDRGAFGDGCSHANCGYVCPSHVMPLCVPGAVSKSILAIFSRNSPLKIRVRFDPALWSWFLRFTFRCNERAMHEACRARQPLLDHSMTLYEQLVAAGDLVCEWKKRGLLNVYRSEQELEAYTPTNKMLDERYGLGAKRLSASELKAAEPALRDEIIGGWLHEHDAHVRPDRVMSSWQKSLLGRGVTIRENCDLIRFRTESGQARSIETSQGMIEGDFFVLATGALAPKFAKALGCKIPVQPGKGYSITMPRPKNCPNTPMIFPECKVAITPFDSGYRIGSTMEFAGYDARLNRNRLSILTNGAAQFLREPMAEPIEEEWFGWRPMSADGIPIIDRSPAMKNVLLATGHSMVGLSMAPSTGKLVAELITGDTPHVDPKPYRVSRF